MRRFLLFLGYSGTRLRGVQKQPNEGVSEGLRSVQGYLEAGLHHLRLADTPFPYFSSRTDAGVHALSNTAHVDLCRRTDGLFYTPDVITKILNRHFIKDDVDIRVHKTLAVPSSFHARHNAIGRSYLYRLAVIKPGADTSDLQNINAFLPIVELQRVHLVRSPFDIKSVVAACQLLEGTHNFATFMSSPSKSSYPVDPNRIIDTITVTKGRPLLDPVYDPLYENLQFWDINISARSFLYKQVRRIVGVLVALAQGRISLECIQQMLDNPAPQNWNSRATTAPAGGLFLLQVKYSPEVFEESFLQDGTCERE